MGTYMNCQLKDISEENIKSVNDELTEAGYPTETYGDIKYGAFTTREQLEEDARWMNNDPEGLAQNTHFKRPITVSFLSKFCWNNIGMYQIKLILDHIIITPQDGYLSFADENLL